jgi:DNA gyrase subunit A
MKTIPKIGKVTGINLVDDTTQLMVVGKFGKIIRIDTKSIRAAGRSTPGRQAPGPQTPGQSSRRGHPPEEAKTQSEDGTLLQ